MCCGVLCHAVMYSGAEPCQVRRRMCKPVTYQTWPGEMRLSRQEHTPEKYSRSLQSSLCPVHATKMTIGMNTGLNSGMNSGMNTGMLQLAVKAELIMGYQDLQQMLVAK